MAVTVDDVPMGVPNLAQKLPKINIFFASVYLSVCLSSLYLSVFLSRQSILLVLSAVYIQVSLFFQKNG